MKAPESKEEILEAIQQLCDLNKDLLADMGGYRSHERDIAMQAKHKTILDKLGMNLVGKGYNDPK